MAATLGQVARWSIGPIRDRGISDKVEGQNGSDMMAKDSVKRGIAKGVSGGKSRKRS